MRVVKSSTIFDAVKQEDGTYYIRNIGAKSQKFSEQDFNANFKILYPPPVEVIPSIGKKILDVDVIPQDKQRYPTCGDWQFNEIGALIMKISDMGNPDYEFMVMIHEAVEAWLCRKRGITAEMVDAWDMGSGKDLEDPGSDAECPYHKEHMLALKIEKMICREMGLDWEAYEKCLSDTCPT